LLRLRKNLEENNNNAIEAMKKEYNTARGKQERRHQNEIKELKQRLEIEKQTWEEKKVNISFSYPLVTKAYPSSLII
jgi:hypothetical protein